MICIEVDDMIGSFHGANLKNQVDIHCIQMPCYMSLFPAWNLGCGSPKKKFQDGGLMTPILE